MTSEKLKKILTMVTIICLATAGLIGILFMINLKAEFINDDFSAFLVNVLLTLLVVFSAGLFLLNAVEAISRKNPLGFVSAGLIGLASLMFLVFIWSDIEKNTTYIHLTWVISAITILFNVIVGNAIVIGKKLLPLQIINYLTLFYVELALVLLLLELPIFFENDMWLLFAIVAIVWIVFSIILSIKKKSILRSKAKSTSVEAPAETVQETVTITKSEYQALLDKIADLENQLANK